MIGVGDVLEGNERLARTAKSTFSAQDRYTVQNTRMCVAWAHLECAILIDVNT